ncbi:hypothetical protein BY458DRAFT_556732 [Sporodiniella umbellata]|nr:hypothetical protein BY458DRAFT_556732 [Sporodiniella umbellata]
MSDNASKKEAIIQMAPFGKTTFTITLAIRLLLLDPEQHMVVKLKCSMLAMATEKTSPSLSGALNVIS